MRQGSEGAKELDRYVSNPGVVHAQQGNAMEIDVRRQCRQCAQTQTAHRQALPLCLPLAGRNRLALQSPGSQDAVGRQPAGGASTLLQLGTDPAVEV
ncbi:hypothetical protein D3C75_1001700 [compost metagenome]